MKKLLALVLSLVMVLGLAVSANAATSYSDAKDIQYQEAVEVMSALGVLQGDNGAFNPKGVLTREQGAKILSYMLMGGKTGGDTLNTTTAPFADVAADRWSAGAIAYCRNVKILDGVGNGNFNPEGPLTGYAFAKMLLTALGYKAEVEGLTGSDWTINVARLINKIDLADGLGDLQYSQQITRDAAAKLAFNTLSKNMVEYPGAFTVKTSDGTVVDSATVASEVDNASYSYISVNSAASYTGYDEFAGINQYMQFCENYFPTLKMEVVTDDFGVTTDKWFNASNRTDYSRNDTKTIVTTAGDELLATYTGAVKAKTIRALIGGGSVVGGLVGVNNLTGGNNEIALYLDGVAQGAVPALAAVDDADELAYTGYGVVTRVYRNTNTRSITIAVNGLYLAKALANYNSSDKEVAIVVYNNGWGFNNAIVAPAATDLPTKMKLDDFSDIEGISKDDYLVVTMTPEDGALTGDWEIRSWAPAEVLSAQTVSSYRTSTRAGAYNDNGTVTVGGTTYNYNKSVNVSTLADTNNLYTTNYSVNDDTYDFYLDPYGYILGVKEVDTSTKADNYLFVRGATVTALEAKAKVTFMDGTEATITVAKVTDGTGDHKAGDAGFVEEAGPATAHNNGKLTQNAFYKYSKKSNGEYNLTWVGGVATTAATGAIGAHVGAVAQGNIATGYMNSGVIRPIQIDNGGAADATLVATANSKSVAVTDTKCYTGVNNFPKVANTTTPVAVYYLVDADNVILAAFTGAKGSNSSDKTSYAFIWSDVSKGETSAGDAYYTANAIVGGEATTIGLDEASGDAFIATTKVTGLYDISTSDSDGNYEIGAVIGAGGDGDLVQYYVAGITGGNELLKVSNGVLYANGAGLAAVTDDTVYYQIDARATKDVNVKTISDGTLLTLNTNTQTWSVFTIQDSDTAKTVSEVYVVRTA